MHGLIIVKSLLIRVVLIAHGLICTWRVVDTNENQYCWVILVGLGFLLVETGIVVWLRNGREFKTVAFCIIFYLTCTTPSLWIIHVETANRKLYRLAENKLNARATAPAKHHFLTNSTLSPHDSTRFHRLLPTSTPLILSLGHIECHDKAWYYMDEQRWLDAIQETLLILLSLSRFVISNDYMTIERSGIVFLISLIHSADLLSLSHSLQYHDVIIERYWMYIGLFLLTIALFQMAFIDTDGLTPPSSSNENLLRKSSRRISIFQNYNLCPLFRSLFIHDGLLLLYRIFLAANVRCSKPTIIFFMLKNILMMIFQSYRVYKKSKENHQKKLLTTYEHLLDTSVTSRNFPNQKRLTNSAQRLLHRTIRRPLSIFRRRQTKTPRTIHNSTVPSISYPFVRRRNDGGRSRTAFAFYGLPFQTPQQIAQSSPSSSSSSSSSSSRTITTTSSSLLAKAFAH